MTVPRGRALLAALCGASLCAGPPAAHARVGFGDPVEPYRDHQPGQTLDLHAHLRLRTALYGNMDLDRGPSPTSGQPLWPKGETPLDLTAGGDLRLRVAPTLWLGEEARIVMEIDVLDNVALGATPKGTPYQGRAAVVTGTVFQDPYSLSSGILRIRTAFAEVVTPVGVLSAGRSPTHFGLGIGSNAGDAMDDDKGDRADRVAFVMPVLGHFLATSLDLSATGPRGVPAVSAPQPQLPSLAQPAVSVALLRYRAPWEVEANRARNRWLLDYGAAGSVQVQRNDAPVFYQSLQGMGGLAAAEHVRRDYVAAFADAWVRFVWGPVRVEAEALLGHLWIGNASPYPGIEMRKPVTGNPFGAVLQAEWLPLKGRFSVVGETGIASPDPAPGFPQDEPSAFAGSRPGDVFGPQIDGQRDRRMDAFRFHPAYHVDLIMWRTLLGGVSEAAYARVKLGTSPLQDVRVELNTIYSHGIVSRSNPGGVGPLGVEFDSSVAVAMGAFTARLDGGVLVPLGGLGRRGGHTPRHAQMVLVRLAYAR
jgi:uncharacterized protein (TIGR04551 family)